MQMKCMNCGAPLGSSSYCPKCGFDVVTQKKVYLLSNLYYNRGLEKAEIRDLSGAIDMLQRSLKFNKLNIPARNLLGLVYFETGEAVSALSEWVISNNIMPENNIATEYIQRLQGNANKLDVINQTIKKYNEALQCCRSGSQDVAAIQLKKILSQNPKLIKAYHLLSLIYIDRKEYEKARRILKKAAKIDKTNARTLRFLKEIDEQTGTRTNLDSRWNFRRNQGEDLTRPASAAESIIPPAFKESSMFSTILNLGFGIVLGALIVGFLIIPARTRSINRETSEKVSQYSSTMASQSTELTKLQEEIETSKETVESAEDQIDEAKTQVSSYENLIKAWNAYQNENYDNAANALAEVRTDDLSVEAKSIYDDVFENIQTTLFNNYKASGISFFDNKDYPSAISQLEAAAAINDSDYEVLNYLAHAYRLNGDTDKAIEIFQKIIEQNADSQRAVNAQSYIDAINNGDEIGEVDLTVDPNAVFEEDDDDYDDSRYDYDDDDSYDDYYDDDYDYDDDDSYDDYDDDDYDDDYDDYEE